METSGAHAADGSRPRAAAGTMFRPAWWLPSPHLQTLWGSLARRPPRVPFERERLELPDGDFLDLDWTSSGSAPGASAPGPVVLLLHGLEGSSRSGYARGLLAAVRTRGWQGAVMHFRGCSGEPNRLSRSYHSGETGDLQAVVERLRARNPAAGIAVVGYSLGGNVLLKWLGELGPAAPLDCAVAVSVPFELGAAADRLARGFSRLYQYRLLYSLKRSTRRKVRLGVLHPRYGDLSPVRDFRAFDDRVTAPLHGFRDACHYYTVSSCRQYLAGIRVPTLVLHARDDPFLTPAAIPGPGEVSPAVDVELSACGGHVGFVGGPWPWHAEYWLEQRIPAFLADHLPAAVRPG